MEAEGSAMSFPKSNECLYFCIFVCLYICTFVYLYVCIFVFEGVCVCLCVYVTFRNTQTPLFWGGGVFV